MASNRKIVLLSGRLVGMGQEADCIVGAVKVTLPGTSLSEYTRCTIHSVSDDLPEGDYIVNFAGQTAKVRKQNGQWLAG